MFTTDALIAALADRYAIERLIGEGGMAKVYLARDFRHNRRVALKVLRPDLGAVVGVERFQAEIETTANLQHPNLLPLFDSGAAGDLLFYVMPYVEGESLRARLDREKQLPVDEAIRITTAIAAALDYAHRSGVIHRDLKPENVLMQDGQPIVADFGIALALSNAGGARITQTGLSLGTPQYMSPEQATGDRVIDARTDIYSLGALAYEMLTGEPPHVGATAQAIIARVLTENPRPMRVTRPAIPEQVDAAVRQALEKLPADRWTSAREFADALQGRQASRYTTPAPTSVSRTRRIRELVAWSLVAILAVASGLAFYTRGERASPEVSGEFTVDIPDSLELRAAGSSALLAVSRDGRSIVFSGAPRAATRTKLYLRRMGERTVQPIPGTDDGLSPVISPDGSEVLFAVFNPTGGRATIKRVSLSGGAVSTVSTRGPRNGQLSWREGREILMQTPDFGVALVNVDNGAERVVGTPDTTRGEFRLGFPEVLPGGRKALVSLVRPTAGLVSGSLGVITLPEGKITDLGVRGLYPRYSASGHVVYVTTEQNLAAIPFDAGKGRVTGAPVLLAEGIAFGSGGAAAVAVTDNGVLAFVPGSGPDNDVEPVLVNRNGTRRSFGAPPGVYRHPRVAPEGRQIAYVSGAGRTLSSSLPNPDIWRMDLATGRSTRVTTDQRSDRPSWSSDGTEIYYSKDPRDTIQFAIGLTAESRPRMLFRGPGLLGSSDFGPPGTWAVIAIQSAVSPDLWIAPMDSLQKPRVFAAEPYVEALPRISPDGRLVAYSSERSGSSEIYVRRLSGGEEVRVSSDLGNDAAWSRDGREVFYRSAERNSMMAAQITTTPRLAASNNRPLFSLVGFFTSATRTVYDVLPSGEFVMLSRSTNDSTRSTRPQIVVRTNWAARLEAARSGRQE